MREEGQEVIYMSNGGCCGGECQCKRNDEKKN
jgi:hypothetical protein